MPAAKRRKKRKFRVKFTYKGEPLTKSNAHQVKWSRKLKRNIVFIPKKIKDYEANLKKAAKKAMKRRRPTKKLVRMTIRYYLGTKRRKDLQNLPKTTCDALNKVVYQDDNQIHKLIIYKKLDRENPRVEVLIEEMSDKDWERD